MSKFELISEIEKLSEKPNLTDADIRTLSGRLNELKATKDEISEAIDVLPALQKYKAEHSIINLQKVCVEIAELCGAVYASTQSEEERAVYRHMVERITR